MKQLNLYSKPEIEIVDTIVYGTIMFDYYSKEGEGQLSKEVGLAEEDEDTDNFFNLWDE